MERECQVCGTVLIEDENQCPECGEDSCEVEDSFEHEMEFDENFD